MYLKKDYGVITLCNDNVDVFDPDMVNFWTNAPSPLVDMRYRDPSVCVKAYGLILRPDGLLLNDDGSSITVSNYQKVADFMSANYGVTIDNESFSGLFDVKEQSLSLNDIKKVALSEFILNDDISSDLASMASVDTFRIERVTYSIKDNIDFTSIDNPMDAINITRQTVNARYEPSVGFRNILSLYNGDNPSSGSLFVTDADVLAICQNVTDDYSRLIILIVLEPYALSNLSLIGKCEEASYKSMMSKIASGD